MILKYLLIAALCDKYYVTPAVLCKPLEARVNGKCVNRYSIKQNCFGTNVESVRYKRQAVRLYQSDRETLRVGFLPWLERDTLLLKPPVTYYQVDYTNGRTEVMSAFITLNDLYTGTNITSFARGFARVMGKNNDVAGYILANRLGGSGSDVRNIFPQGYNFNTQVWAAVEEVVATYVLNSKASPAGVRFTVNLQYIDRQATRPYSIVYQIEENGINIFRGDVENPE